MARKASINDEELIGRLSTVFRDVGFSGASIAALSDATGLKRASLYHRFPEGKEQMARETLRATRDWLGENILKPLEAEGLPRERLRIVIKNLGVLYSNGKQACLLNMLSSSHIGDGVFAKPIKAIFTDFIAGFSGLLKESGFEDAVAKTRAERAVMLLQGSLVLSRGMGTNKPFMSFLTNLPDELFGDEVKP
jgi:AcrR family transcriptional regulator